MRGGLIEIDVGKFSERWLKEMLVFLNLRGFIKMLKQWLDYYLFLIMFEWVLYKWQPFWHSFKSLLRSFPLTR
jgi:hypothetical protein